MFDDLLKYILVTTIAGSVAVTIFFLIKPFLKMFLNFKWLYRLQLISILMFLLPFGFLISGFIKLPYIGENYYNSSSPVVENNVDYEDFNGSNSVYTEYDKTLINNEQEYGRYKLPFDIKTCLTLIWFGGFLCFHFIKVSEYISFKRKVLKFNKEKENKELYLLFETVKSELRIKNNILLFINEKVSSPIICGLFRTVVIVPNIKLSEEEWHYVFLHELTHYKQGDLWVKIISTFANGVHWFNPFSYIIFSRVNSICEFSCDEALLLNMNATQKKRYGMTILNILEYSSKQKELPYPAFSGARKRVEERLEVIVKYKYKRIKKIIPITIVLIMALLSAFPSTAFLREVSGIPQLNYDSYLQDNTPLENHNNNSSVDSLSSVSNDKSKVVSTNNDDIKIEIEWWTYDDYKEYAEEQVKSLNSDTVKISGVIISDVEKSYMNNLKNIENGDLHSKTIKVNGMNWDKSSITVTPIKINTPFGITINDYIIQFSGVFNSTDEFFEKFKTYCDDMVIKDKLSQYNADVEYAIWKTALSYSHD